jgi:hypothetical protein
MKTKEKSQKKKKKELFTKELFYRNKFRPNLKENKNETLFDMDSIFVKFHPHCMNIRT